MKPEPSEHPAASAASENATAAPSKPAGTAAAAATPPLAASSSPMPLLVILVAVGAACTALYGEELSALLSPPTVNLRPPDDGELLPVRVVDLRDDVTLSETSIDPEEIIATRVPTILPGKNLDEIWAVLQARLTLNILGKRKSMREEIIPDVRVHSGSNVFVAHTFKSSQLPHKLPAESGFEYKNMSMKDFLARAEQRDDERMQASFTVHGTTLEPWTLDLEDFFSVNDTQEAQSLRMPRFKSTVLAWFGEQDSVSNLHYDRSHNFITMIEGEKEVTIVPPSEWPYLYLYPWLHPGYQQTQSHHFDVKDGFLQEELPPRSDGKEPTRKFKFPSLGSVRATKITLKAGDILYLPPFWLHKVESKKTSFSVSVVSPSKEEMFFSDAYWKIKPFSEDWPTSLKVIAVRHVLEMIFEALGLTESPKEFIRRALKNSRYSQPLVRQVAERMAVPEAFDCLESSTIKDEHTLQVFRSAVNNGTDALRRVARLQPDVLDILLANLAEEYFRFALGVYNMAAHINACY